MSNDRPDALTILQNAYDFLFPENDRDRLVRDQFGVAKSDVVCGACVMGALYFAEKGYDKSNIAVLDGWRQFVDWGINPSSLHQSINQYFYPLAERIARFVPYNDDFSADEDNVNLVIEWNDHGFTSTDEVREVLRQVIAALKGEPAT